MSTYVLFNMLSGNGRGKEKADELKVFLRGKKAVYKDITKIKDWSSFFADLNFREDEVISGPAPPRPAGRGAGCARRRRSPRRS